MLLIPPSSNRGYELTGHKSHPPCHPIHQITQSRPTWLNHKNGWWPLTAFPWPSRECCYWLPSINHKWVWHGAEQQQARQLNSLATAGSAKKLKPGPTRSSYSTCIVVQPLNNQTATHRSSTPCTWTTWTHNQSSCKSLRDVRQSQEKPVGMQRASVLHKCPKTQ